MAGPAAADAPKTPNIPPISEPAIHLVALNVTDIERSMAFYRDGLGMREVTRFTKPGETEVLMGYGTDQIVMVLVHKTGQPALQIGNGFSRIGLLVPSVVAVMEGVRKAGYPAPGAPRQGPGAILGFITDPDGYRIELIQPNSNSRPEQ